MRGRGSLGPSCDGYPNAVVKMAPCRCTMRIHGAFCFALYNVHCTTCPTTTSDHRLNWGMVEAAMASSPIHFLLHPTSRLLALSARRPHYLPGWPHTGHSTINKQPTRGPWGSSTPYLQTAVSNCKNGGASSAVPSQKAKPIATPSETRNKPLNPQTQKPG